jgi:hypothetical protein
MISIATGKAAKGIFSYLNEIDQLCSLKSTVKTVDEFLELGHLDKCLAIRAAFIVREVVKNLAKKDIKKKVAMNDLYAVDLLQMSKSHHLYMSFVIFVRSIENRQFKCPNIKPLLLLLAKIFALKQLTLDCTTLYETGFFNSGSKGLLLDSLKKALIELRPHMIPLVELKTDELMDFSYMSAIGNKYGDIYERQLELAMGSRLNKKAKPEYWDTLVKPIMQAKL